MLSSLYFPPSLRKIECREKKKIQIIVVSRNDPSPRSPTAPSSGVPDSRRLGSAFEAMFLDASDVAGGHFDDDWGVADTELALALSFVDDARLKACIVAASASVWGVPMMCPAQLEACYRLLHPHRPNSLVVVHRTGGGRLTSYELSV